MIGQQHKLRKAEIDRLSSPDQLDTPMRVTTPLGWISLVFLIILILAVVAWGIWGTWTERVEGTGMILQAEGVMSIQSPVAGKVREIKVEVGDVLQSMPAPEVAIDKFGCEDSTVDKESSYVALIEVADRKELENQINASQARISEFTEKKVRQDERTRKIKASYEIQKKGLEEKLENKEKLLRENLARKQDVLAVKGEIAAVQAKIDQTESGESNLEFSLNEEKRTLCQLQNRMKGTKVVSSHSGKVAAILVSESQVIQAGDRLINLEGEEVQGREQQIMLFVSFAEGKKVDPGMDINISPATISPEEYGYIRGEIVDVSRLPVTPEEVRADLNIDTLAQKFAEDTPFRVIARLHQSQAGELEWTSAKGAKSFPKIDSNTPCTGQIITDDTKKPIELVIPKIRKTLGL